MSMNKLEKVLLVAAFTFLVGLVMGVLVYIPFSEISKSACLEAGYPKYSVTYDFKVYCISMDGLTVTQLD